MDTRNHKTNSLLPDPTALFQSFLITALVSPGIPVAAQGVAETPVDLGAEILTALVTIHRKTGDQLALPSESMWHCPTHQQVKQN